MNLLCDLWKLLLHDLRHIWTGSFQNCEQSKHDPSDLEFQLKVAHKVQPIGEHKVCLSFLLDNSQCLHIVVEQSHRQSLEQHRFVIARSTPFKSDLKFGQQHTYKHGKGLINLPSKVLKDGNEHSGNRHSILLVHTIGVNHKNSLYKFHGQFEVGLSLTFSN